MQESESSSKFGTETMQGMECFYHWVYASHFAYGIEYILISGRNEHFQSNTFIIAYIPLRNPSYSENIFQLIILKYENVWSISRKLFSL